MEPVIDSVPPPKKSFREILGAAPVIADESASNNTQQQQEHKHKQRRQRHQKRDGKQQHQNKQRPLSLVEAITIGDSNSTRVRRILSDMAAAKAKKEAAAESSAAPTSSDGFQKVRTRKVPLQKEKEQQPKASNRSLDVPQGTPLTFEEIKVDNLYLVRKKPDYWGATKYQNYLMRCIGKSVQNGKNCIDYQMVLDLCLVPGDPGENCGSTYCTSEFSNQTFKRIPRDLFTNYSKYENTIKLRYFDEDAALDYMY